MSIKAILDKNGLPLGNLGEQALKSAQNLKIMLDRYCMARDTLRGYEKDVLNKKGRSLEDFEKHLKHLGIPLAGFEDYILREKGISHDDLENILLYHDNPADLLGEIVPDLKRLSLADFNVSLNGETLNNAVEVMETLGEEFNDYFENGAGNAVHNRHLDSNFDLLTNKENVGDLTVSEVEALVVAEAVATRLCDDMVMVARQVYAPDHDEQLQTAAGKYKYGISWDKDTWYGAPSGGEYYPLASFLRTGTSGVKTRGANFDINIT